MRERDYGRGRLRRGGARIPLSGERSQFGCHGYRVRKEEVYFDVAESLGYR